MSQNFQAPVKYEPPTTVLAKLGIADERSQQFVFAQAAIMKVDPGHLDIPENIAEVIKSVQYTRQYGFMPGIHLHMTPFKTKAKRKLENGNAIEVWEDRVQLVVGEQAYKAAARIQANKEGDHIEFEWEALKPEELTEYIAETMPKDFELTDEDRGVRARVLSYKGAQMAVAMGRKYDPEWSYGFCFMKGIPKSGRDGKYYPKSDRERIPSQRTALDVAVRRAIKNAIMKQYHLTPIDGRSEEQRMNDVIVTAAQEEARQAEKNIMFAPRADLREEDGDVLFDYAPPTHRNGASQPPTEDDGIEDGVFSDESAGDATPEPADILNDPDIHEAVKGFVESLRKLEQPGAKHATTPQYQYAVGVIDAICGKGSHGYVFDVIFSRPVSKEAPIAAAAAQEIFKRLCETKTVGRDENNKPIKADNPDYDPQDVAILCEVGKWAVAQGMVPA